MTRFLDSPLGWLAISTVTAVLTGVAIVAFGAPPITLLWVTYGMVAILCPLTFRAQRYRGRR